MRFLYGSAKRGGMSQAKESENAAGDFTNQLNSTGMDKQMYITLSALVLDNDGTVSFARAGHMLNRNQNSTGITFHHERIWSWISVGETIRCEFRRAFCTIVRRRYMLYVH